MNRKFLLAALVLIAAVFLCGCTSDGGNDTATATTAAPTDTGTAATPEFLKIATTTSLDNTGLLADLKDRFEEDHDVTLQIIAAGTGKALEYGERGDVDVLMVHDRAREDVFMDNGYTKEEMKMVWETRKILHAPELRVTATTVRVPVFYSHSESINVEFEEQFDINELRHLLASSNGIIVQDEPTANIYPLAKEAAGMDEVFVGRIRRDESLDSGINMWVVADNIRKGAATNAVQIAQELIRIWENS